LPTIRPKKVITLGQVPSDDLHMSSGPFDPSRFDEVIARAGAGDPHAVEELFLEVQPRLPRFLRSQESRVDASGLVSSAQTATISREADLAVDPPPCEPSPSPREALDKVFVRADTSLLIWVFR
jgi:hypothetical protein